ncbi:hypothetical protein DL771_006497 [Monosporascus sp. 5C6A]|nr:hypothetical protein DL771_006497 [Monosporascus sp. 5C6A]
MTRYNLIKGTAFSYTGWVPVPLEGRDPYVRSPVYRQIFAADVLGHHPEVQVYERPDLAWNISAYGIYESGALSKYVVVNYDEWNATTPYERPVQEVALAVPSWVDHVMVKRLTADGASADEGIQWAGQSWSNTDGRLVQSGREKSDCLHASNGMVELKLSSTEVMLVSLARRGQAVC